MAVRAKASAALRSSTGSISSAASGGKRSSRSAEPQQGGGIEGNRKGSAVQDAPSVAPPGRGVSEHKGTRREVGVDDGLSARALIDCIELVMEGQQDVLFQISLDAFIQRYEDSPAEGLVELANCVVHAAGLRQVYLDLSALDLEEEGDPIEELFTDTKLKALIATAEANGTHEDPYPFVDKKMGRRYKAATVRVLTTLLGKVKHELFFDERLVPWLLEWLMMMSMSSHRAVRHTGCELSMALLTHFAAFATEIGQARQVKERLKSSKRRKDQMGDALSADADRLAMHEDKVKSMMQIIFEQVCVNRYRDTNDEIRSITAHHLGRAVSECPSFLNDAQLKYLGWLLNDPGSAAVRAESLGSLHEIYKAQHSAKNLRRVLTFTQRFEHRFYELIRDVDRSVQTEAIRIVTTLRSYNLLLTFESTKSACLRLMCSSPPKTVMKALGPLLQLHVQPPTTLAASADVDGSGAHPTSTLAAGSSTRLSKSPLVQIAVLLLHDDEERHQSTQCGEEGSEAAVLRREARIARRCKQAVRAMRPVEPALTDWSAYLDVLTADDDLDEALEAALPVVLHLMKESAAATNAAYDILDSRPDAEERSKRGARSRAVAQEMQEGAVALSAALGKSISTLLQRFGARAAPLRTVLALVAQLRLPAAQANLKGKRFDELLAQLESATLKHADAATLAASARAWFAILRQEEVPAMHEAVAVRFRRLVAEFLSGLRPLSVALKSKKAEPSSSTLRQTQVVLHRLEMLTVDEGQSLPQTIGLADRLLALGAAHPGAFEAFDVYMKHQRSFESFELSPHKPKAPGATTSSVRAKTTFAPIAIAEHAHEALFAGRLGGCLASLLRLQTAQLVHLVEQLLVHQKPPTSSMQRKGEKASVEAEVQAGTNRIVRELVAARRRLLPSLRTTIELPSASLVQFAAELVGSIVTPLSIYAEHANEYQLEEDVEEDDEADMLEEGGWLSALHRSMQEGIRSLFVALAAADHVNEPLPPKPSFDGSFPEDVGGGVSGKHGEADTTLPAEGKSVHPKCCGSDWLTAAIMCVHPAHVSAPSPRLLALLLAAPEAAKTVSYYCFLEQLWLAYDRHMPHLIDPEEHSKALANSLITACALPPWPAGPKHDTMLGDGAELMAAEEAAATFALLHQSTYRSASAAVRGDSLLVSVLVRGLLWAHSQSEAALKSNRGAWVDACLAKLVQILPPAAAARVSDKLQEMQGTVPQPPECSQFQAALAEAMAKPARGSRSARSKSSAKSNGASRGAKHAAPMPTASANGASKRPARASVAKSVAPAASTRTHTQSGRASKQQSTKMDEDSDENGGEVSEEEEASVGCDDVSPGAAVAAVGEEAWDGDGVEEEALAAAAEDDEDEESADEDENEESADEDEDEEDDEWGIPEGTEEQLLIDHGHRHLDQAPPEDEDEMGSPSQGETPAALPLYHRSKAPRRRAV